MHKSRIRRLGSFAITSAIIATQLVAHTSTAHADTGTAFAPGQVIDLTVTATTTGITAHWTEGALNGGSFVKYLEMLYDTTTGKGVQGCQQTFSSGGVGMVTFSAAALYPSGNVYGCGGSALNPVDKYVVWVEEETNANAYAPGYNQQNTVPGVSDAVRSESVSLTSADAGSSAAAPVSNVSSSGGVGYISAGWYAPNTGSNPDTSWVVNLYQQSDETNNSPGTLISTATVTPTGNCYTGNYCSFTFSGTTMTYYYVTVTPRTATNVVGPSTSSPSSLDPLTCYDKTNHCWGNDALAPVTSDSLASAKNTYGDGYMPDFFGRYLVDYNSPSDVLSPNEVSLFQQNNVGIMLLDGTSANCPAGKGAAYATEVVKAAQAKGIAVPANMHNTIFLDIEAGYTPDEQCLKDYSDTLVKDGYVPGFYSPGESAFGTPFCDAASSDANVKSAQLYSSEPEPGNSTGTGPKGAPSFAPNKVSCAATHQTAAWQYIETASGDPFDRDELDPSDTNDIWQAS